MPIMNGLECLKNIKRNLNTNEIPVIMVTSESERHMVLEAIKAGAASYVRKPVEEEDLRDKITSAIEGL